MFKQAIKKVVAAGLALCIVAGTMLMTPPALVCDYECDGYGYENVVPHGAHPPGENPD